MREYRFTFGKYKGCGVDEIDVGYAEWVLANFDSKHPARVAIIMFCDERGIDLGQNKELKLGAFEDYPDGYFIEFMATR